MASGTSLLSPVRFSGIRAARLALAAVCGILLASSTSGSGGEAAGRLSVGKPFGLTPELALAGQHSPALAWGGGGYLVVWQEGEGFRDGKDARVLGARVSREGKPLDPMGFPISQGKGSRRGPAVAYDGAGFLVAWEDNRDGEHSCIYAARVTPEGKVLDRDGFRIPAAPAHHHDSPTVASDGNVALVAWSWSGHNTLGTFVCDGEAPYAGLLEPAKVVCRLYRPLAVWDGEAFRVIGVHVPRGYGGEPVPRALRISSRCQGQLWNTPAYVPETISVATDPVGKRSLVWSNGQLGRRRGQVWYVAALVQEPKTGAGTSHVVLGLQEQWPPREVVLWCAATFDGRNFVAVVEQSSPTDESREDASVSFELVAVRFDPVDGRPLDAGGLQVPGGLRELWDSQLTVAYREAKAKAAHGMRVASEPRVQLRHPALASAGGGRSLLVYSRHGGIGDFRIQGVLIEE